MSYIGHRCDCGHSDLQHSGDGTGSARSAKNLGACQAAYGHSCRRPCGPIPEPEVIPTYDAKGHPVERVIEPGGALMAVSGAPVVRTCPCEACAALYAEVADGDA